MNNKMHELIQEALSPDTQKRNAAEKKILDIQQQDFTLYITSLTEILTTEESRSDIRFTSGVILRNSLFNNDYQTFLHLENSWLSINHEQREKIKKSLFSNLQTLNVRAGTISASVLACVIRIEYPKQVWNSCFVELLNLFKISQSIFEKKNILSVTMNAVLYLKDFTPQEQVFGILVVRLVPEEDQNLLEHNLKCLLQSLDHLQKITSQYGNNLIEILTKLCNINEEITALAIQNITKFISYGIFFIKDITNLRTFINSFMQKEENIVLHAIEFFTTLADHEKKTKNQYITDFLPVILLNLFFNLKKDDDFDDEEWSAYKAASSCIQSISSIVNILSDSNIRNYINEKLNSNDIKTKEEGILALGSSLVFSFYGNFLSSHEMKPNKYFIHDEETALFIKNSVPLILNEIRISNDPNVVVDEEIKNSALWCLGRICETNFMCVDPTKDLPLIMEKCQQVLQEKSKESYNAAWVLSSICASVANHTDINARCNSLTFYYYKLIDVLVFSSDEIDFNNFALRNAVFTALQEAVRACAKDSAIVLDNLFHYFYSKIRECLSFIKDASDDHFNILEDLLSNYILLLQVIYSKKTEKEMGDKKKDFINVYLEVLMINKNTILFADVYTSLSMLCEDKSFFIISIDRFIPFILRDLENTERHILISVLSLIGDVANAMSVGFISCSNLIITGLIKCLQRQDTSREIKPLIINIFGDIAMSLGLSFEPCLEICLSFLNQIMSLRREMNEDYVDDLRKSVLNFLSCVLISLESGLKIRIYLDGIAEVIRQVCVEDIRKYNIIECLQIIGDFEEFYGRKKEYEWMYKFVLEYKEHPVYKNVACDVFKRIEVNK
ncbi:karyopherin Kap95 [Gurleya vavrai]